MFRDAIISTYGAEHQLVGLCDTNPHRLELSAGQTRQITGQPVAQYGADDFDRMLAEQKPDIVVVTVPDYLHERYIARALELGTNVVTEKPMTIDVGKLASVLGA
jgi:predicted dehydrogenase